MRIKRVIENDLYNLIKKKDIMNNNYFILSKSKLSIERFQICTWKLKGKDAFVELGVEIKNENLLDEFDVFLAVPFAKSIVRIHSLHARLAIADNCKLIFNDTMTNQKPIGKDSHKGSIISFSNRNELAIVSVDSESLNDEGLVKFHVKTPQEKADSVYFRVLVELSIKDLAIVHSGINKKTFVYDFKVNETRNLPESVYKYKEGQGLCICDVASVFLFHCVPDNFDVNYIDSGKLRNIRRLETDSFNKYLNKIETIEDDNYIIVFLKSKGNENYSFFSTFVKEHIGNKQIIFAVLANIVCSVLLAYDKWINWEPIKQIIYYGSFIPVWGYCVIAFLSFVLYIGVTEDLKKL